MKRPRRPRWTNCSRPRVRLRRPRASLWIHRADRMAQLAVHTPLPTEHPSKKHRLHSTFLRCVAEDRSRLPDDTHGGAVAGDAVDRGGAIVALEAAAIPTNDDPTLARDPNVIL